MSAISPLKLSLEGGWSNRIGGYYTLDVVILTVTYHLFLSIREEILFYPLSRNEWDMKYLLPTATLSPSLCLSHTLTLSFQPYYQTTTSFYDSYYNNNSIKRKHKGKKSLPRQNDCHPSLYTPPPHTGLLFYRYSSSSSSNKEE